MERKKSLGQCFLEDRNILRLEAQLAKPEGKTVLEIGAGDGRLTEALLQLKPKKIIAVELDPKFASLLREKFAGQPVEVLEADVLKAELPPADVIVGNIPYYISSDIVFRLKDMRFEHAVLMVQKEFAEKMAAKPGDGNYGRLSVTAQLNYGVRLERKVLRHLFRPVPKVDSAIIILKPSGITLTAFQENVIRSLFQHKNRTVRNALISSKLFGEKEIAGLGPFLVRRPRTLTKEECLEIARLLG
ncbi:MAG: 16S rRNA (adenine(1518)-N(6)/adenine(1519)-N(6))-dimethyltransferase RsmA [Candidatus ainarchaeum sp.]|nr:16S rRNA (adenine(1518)-N(6)/adenine(1519)-N(6))-dimethyltransferase RsmA [Candidatus ainarchaeum sp.]